MQLISFTVGLLSTRSDQSLARHGRLASRFTIAVKRISRQPPTVLTFTPSLLISGRPEAFWNALTGSGDCSIHRRAPSPSSWHTASMVSSETLKWQNSFRCELARSNDQLVPASVTNRRAPDVSERLSNPAHRSHGTTLAAYPGQAK